MQSARQHRIEPPRGRKTPRRLSARRKTLLEQGVSQFGINAKEIRTATPASCLPQAWFGESFTGKVFLEVGFGGGEHLVAIAQDKPHDGFIGAEVHQGGIANCCALLAENQVENVRLFAEDVRTLLTACTDNTLDGAFVLFPDPWPKRRHAKRRIISQDFLDELARVLRKGAVLQAASDDPVCQVSLLQELLAHKAFAWNATQAVHPARCWTKPPPNWHSTRYEAKALKAGRKPIYLTLVRV